MYSSPYPIPAITTTAIIATVDKVLLIRRKNEPFKDKWAFPGGFFNQFESATDCCIREVLEETNIDLTSHIYSATPVNVLSNKDRDPRGWVIDCPFFIRVESVQRCKAQDDAQEIKWFDISDVDKMDLAFDHSETWKYIRLHFSDWFFVEFGETPDWLLDKRKKRKH